jgi:hypothetical protein
MFVRDHLNIVAQWARLQLSREGVSLTGADLLRQLVDAAEALRDELTYEPEDLAENVVSLADFRRRAG